MVAELVEAPWQPKKTTKRDLKAGVPLHSTARPSPEGTGRTQAVVQPPLKKSRDAPWHISTNQTPHANKYRLSSAAGGCGALRGTLPATDDKPAGFALRVQGIVTERM